MGMRVLVTGAGGRTGQLVFEQLQKDKSVQAVGLVRSRKAVKALKKVGAEPLQVVRADTTVLNEVTAAMENCDAVVLCTSAVPKIKPLSIAKLLFKKAILRSKDPGRPQFRFESDGTPQEVTIPIDLELIHASPNRRALLLTQSTTSAQFSTAG
jgi:hypothetical protein